MLNAHIVASTTICFELTNVTTPSMAFRVEADPDAFEFYDWENQPHAIADIFGMESMDELLEGDAVQELGSVKLPLGRMLTYPHAMEKKLGPLELVDRNHARGGRCRFLTVHLVDPHYRICSTRNVPPQQHDWFAAEGMDKISWHKWGVPPEIVSITSGFVGGFSVGAEGVEEIRREYVEEYKVAMEAIHGGIALSTFEY